MEATKTNHFFIKQGLSSNAIKLFAAIAMFLDHISVFIPSNTPIFWCMRLLGRAAAPIFFYFIVEGYNHTHNKNKYTFNLAIFSIISYVPFILCFDGTLNANTFLNFNVIYNLLIGLLIVRTRHEIKNIFLRWPLICLLFLLSCFGDWGYVAPLTILIFDLYYGNRKNQLCAYTLMVILRTGLLLKIVHPFSCFARFRTFDFSEWHNIIGYDLGMLIPIIFLLLYNDKKGSGGAVAKWGFYIFYPVHLLLIAIVKMYLLK